MSATNKPDLLADFGDDDDIECTELEQQFNAAAKRLEQLVGQLDQQQLLQFYGLYKQATVGPCNTAKPGLFALQSKAKWYAWNELGSMASEEAMRRYVAKMTELQPDWLEQSASSGGGGTKSSWAAVSRPVCPAAEQLPSGELALIDYIKEGRLSRVVLLLPLAADVNALDADGLALLHWAADRGNVRVLQAVLRANGLDVNGRDASGQTALHYACSVGHAECVAALLRAGADRGAVDADGQTCADVAACKEIREMVQ